MPTYKCALNKLREGVVSDLTFSIVLTLGLLSVHCLSEEVAVGLFREVLVIVQYFDIEGLECHADGVLPAILRRLQFSIVGSAIFRNDGAKSVLPPTTEPWGQRTCYVADPDGNLIEIGSFIEK